MTHSFGLINLLERLTELRKTLTSTSLLKDIIKVRDEQPDEEKHRVRSRKVLNAGASVPVELGVGVSPSRYGCICQPGSSSNPTLLGFYGGFLT